MAHSYSNFADAFADLCGRNSLYRSNLDDCFDKCNDADDYADAGNWESAIHYCVYAIKAMATAVDQIIHGQYFDPDDSWFYESIYWASQEGGNGEIDMSAILDAMWDAEGGQPLTFINYIDAMRGSVSEKTVYAPYLESYLKHFI